MSKTQNLMAIATNSSLRIHERIKLIKESDGKKGISSQEEARAIIAIPAKDLILTDNKSGLSTEKMFAQSYLKNDRKNLWDDLDFAYNYCKKRGRNLISQIQDYFKPKSSIIAKNK